MLSTLLLLTTLIAQATGDRPVEGRHTGIFTFRPAIDDRRPQIVDARPELIEQFYFPPSYSRDAERRRIQGSVSLEVMVAADGTVKVVKVVRSLHPDLDRSSVDAARKFRFHPARSRGRAASAPVGVRVTFSLADRVADSRTRDIESRFVTVEIDGEA